MRGRFNCGSVMMSIIKREPNMIREGWDRLRRVVVLAVRGDSNMEVATSVDSN